MNNNNLTSNDAVNDAHDLAAAVDASIAELDKTVFGDLNSTEQAAERRIRLAAKRLLQCAEELASGPLLIPDLTGQQRPHPLLKVEHDLRREIIDAVEKLTFSATNRSFVDKQKAHHRALRARRRRPPQATGHAMSSTATPDSRPVTRNVAELREHPQAATVPPPQPDTQPALRADLATNGIQVPLEITNAGVVLDGRARLQIARELAMRLFTRCSSRGESAYCADRWRDGMRSFACFAGQPARRRVT